MSDDNLPDKRGEWDTQGDVERIDLDVEPDDGLVPDDDEVLIGAPSDEVEATRAAYQDEIDPEAPQGESWDQYKVRKREELGGMGLAWWEDNSLFSGLGVLGKVLDSAVDTVETMQAMYTAGLPETVLVASVPVTLVSGPLLLSALQVLGLFEPRLRDDIEDVMRTFAAAQPTPTEEEQELLNEYGAKAAEVLFGQFVNDIEAMGGQVIRADDFAAPSESNGAELN